MRPSTGHPSPTARQLRYLKALAEQTGTSFAYPRTRAQASAEIDRLRCLSEECEHGVLEEPTPAYATALQPDEVSGFGSGASWRARSRAGAAHAVRPSASRDSHPRGPAASRSDFTPTVRRLGSYAAAGTGEARELVSVPGAGGGTLIVDRVARSLGDARLVARLTPEEPRENALIVCRMYLGDETRGRCRRLSAEDLDADASDASAASAPADASLLDAEGRVYRIREVSCHASLPEVRWTRSCERGREDGFAPLTLLRQGGEGPHESTREAPGLGLHALGTLS
jgi:hypothetical protein